MTTQRPLIQIYNTEAGQTTAREMDDTEYSVWLSEQTAAQITSMRDQRNTLLASTDWRVIKAAEVGSVLDPAWIIYRQALRDVPKQSGFPWDVIWPAEVPNG